MYIFWESTQIARREHFCDRCFTWIQPGEIYERKMWNPKSGTWFVMKEHVNPGCPEEALEFALHGGLIEEAVTFSFALRMEAVQRVLIGGETVTEFESRMVLVGGTDDDPPL